MFLKKDKTYLRSEQREMIQIRARRCVMSSEKEVDLLTSFLGKRSKMYKVSFLADAIESNNSPLRWNLPIRNSVF
jgi:hypothetical protein